MYPAGRALRLRECIVGKATVSSLMNMTNPSRSLLLRLTLAETQEEWAYSRNQKGSASWTSGPRRSFGKGPTTGGARAKLAAEVRWHGTDGLQTSAGCVPFPKSVQQDDHLGMLLGGVGRAWVGGVQQAHHWHAACTFHLFAHIPKPQATIFSCLVGAPIPVALQSLDIS